MRSHCKGGTAGKRTERRWHVQEQAAARGQRGSDTQAVPEHLLWDAMRTGKMASRVTHRKRQSTATDSRCAVAGGWGVGGGRRLSAAQGDGRGPRTHARTHASLLAIAAGRCGWVGVVVATAQPSARPASRAGRARPSVPTVTGHSCAATVPPESSPDGRPGIRGIFIFNYETD